jgi:hypothetical protein
MPQIQYVDPGNQDALTDEDELDALLTAWEDDTTWFS